MAGLAKTAAVDRDNELHIAVYYRGFLHSTDAVKGALKLAEDFIAKLK